MQLSGIQEYIFFENPVLGTDAKYYHAGPAPDRVEEVCTALTFFQIFMQIQKLIVILEINIYFCNRFLQILGSKTVSLYKKVPNLSYEINFAKYIPLDPIILLTQGTNCTQWTLRQPTVALGICTRLKFHEHSLGG